jgi:hypothetical protein
VPALRGRPDRRALHRGAAKGRIGIQDAALAWTFEPRVDARAYEFLGFAEASAGIARTQRENREGWWAHARRSKGFILDAAARAAQPRLAVVLGAGKAYDLPLAQLAERFERLVLIDIDAAALEATCAAAIRDRGNVELRAMDVTGAMTRLADGIRSALEDPQAGFEALCRSYRLASLPRFAAERADLLVSGMMLSQLGLQAKLAAKRHYEARFGRPFPPSWAAPWDELEWKLQQDHIDSLAEQARLIVLSSDVVHRSAGETWSVIGAPHLEARIPPALRILARAAWSWPRVGPGEVSTEVEALLLEPSAA